MRKFRKFVVTDIDGVLNDHVKTPSGYCGIKPECRDQLNRVINETGAYLVISSAWRYLMYGSMTRNGFRDMLRTHGIKANVIGKIRKDTMIPNPDYRPGIDPDELRLMPLPNERGQQISEWIVGEGWKYYGETGRHVVIDDLDLGITASGHPFVQTDGKVGLTEADADRVIAILKGVTDA